MLSTPLFSPISLFLHLEAQSILEHTLESLICALIPIFVRVCQQTEFAICLFDVPLGGRLFQSENLVKCRCLTLPYSDDGGLLLNGVFPFLISLLVIAGFGGGSITVR